MVALEEGFAEGYERLEYAKRLVEAAEYFEDSNPEASSELYIIAERIYSVLGDRENQRACRDKLVEFQDVMLEF